METITMSEARKVISDTNGKFYSVKFVKKDGSIREMNCRNKVTKHLVGGTSTIAHIPKLQSTYDIIAKGYRCFNYDRLLSVKTGGQEYKVLGE